MGFKYRDVPTETVLQYRDDFHYYEVKKQARYFLYIDGVEYDFGYPIQGDLKGTTADGIDALVRFDGKVISLFINDVQVSYTAK